METKTDKDQSNAKLLAGKRILIVEDDQFILRVYAKWLRSAGAEVLVASDGALGIETLKKETVDLVLLDLGMPGLNGYDTLMELRKDEKNKDLPVIILSNTTMGKGRDGYDEIMKAGVSEILRKYEVSLQDLRNIISKNLP